MSRSRIERLLRDQIELIWGEGRTDLVAANYAEDVVDHMPVPGMPTGKAALANQVHAFRAQVPDLAMDLHHVMAAGDYGLDLWTARGHAATPEGFRPVCFSGIDMIRVAGGQIRDLWHVEELHQFEMQIGSQHGMFGKPEHGREVAASSDYAPDGHAVVPGEAQFTARERRNLATARRHIVEIWAKGRGELCEDVFHPEVIDHNPAPGQKPGIPGIRDVLYWLREAVPDLVMEIQSYLVDGDWIADRWVMTGTHTDAPLLGVPPTGRQFRINGMDVARVDDAGLITDIWHCEEMQQLRLQIGEG